MKKIHLLFLSVHPAVCLISVCLILLGQAIFPCLSQALTDPRPHRASLKIEISRPGIYRIYGSDFAGANINPENIAPETFRIFHLDTEIPVIVSDTDGVFDKTDYVEFYGRGINNQFTGTDIYWLYWNGSDGKRMTWAHRPPDDASTEISTFSQNLTVEENHVMWSNTPHAPEADYWFWEKLTSPKTSVQTFDLPAPVNTSEDATVTVYFQGSTDTGHHTVITLNGQPVSDEVWFGNITKGQSATVPADRLKSRANEIRISAAGDISVSGDVLYLNNIRIKYTRRLTAAGNQLTFELNQDDPVTVNVSGFSTSTVRVFDITDPDNVTRVSGIEIQADTNTYRARFKHPGGERSYLAISSDLYEQYDRISYKPRFNLKNSSNGADYILITGKNLMPGLEKLCELRRRQGFRVMMVDVEDIYDVFSFGFFDPSAIRDFLKYTVGSWVSPAPQYVLLAGDSNLDYRDYFGTGKQNIVPVNLSATFELGLTPSDNDFVTLDASNPLPEMNIGRISGNTSDTLSKTANKIIWYETAKTYAPEQVLFVADDDDPEFENLNDALAGYLAPGYAPVKVYARLYDSLENVTGKILSFIDSGMLITNFVGHGDVIRWGAEPYGGGDFIIEPGDVNDLTNTGNLTFLVALDCLNGYFSQSFDYSLAEEWVMAPDIGAIACFAPSGLSHQWEHELLSEFIFDKIFNEKENRIGVICTESKIDAYHSGASAKVLTSLNLIGDPATTLAIYRDPADMVKVHEINASAGSGGTIEPSGTIPAFENSSEAFTITPKTGYHVLDVSVDGESQGPIEQYTFNNISVDHTIFVEFENDNNSGGGGGGGGGCFISSAKDSH